MTKNLLIPPLRYRQNCYMHTRFNNWWDIAHSDLENLAWVDDSHRLTGLAAGKAVSCTVVGRVFGIRRVPVVLARAALELMRSCVAL